MISKTILTNKLKKLSNHKCLASCMNETWRATSAGLDIYYFKVTNLINQVHYSPNQEYLTMLVTTHFIRRHKAGTREKVI